MKRRTKKQPTDDDSNDNSLQDTNTDIASETVSTPMYTNDESGLSKSIKGNTSLKQYIQNCRNYDVNIDPNIVIALKTE